MAHGAGASDATECLSFKPVEKEEQGQGDTECPRDKARPLISRAGGWREWEDSGGGGVGEGDNDNHAVGGTDRYPPAITRGQPGGRRKNLIVSCCKNLRTITTDPVPE